MAADMFLKLDGIKGESQDKTHKDQIDVLAWSWGVTNASSSHTGGGGGTGKVNINDIHVTKHIDASSHALFLSCASGEHIKTASFIARKAGKAQQEYLKIKLEEVFITSVTNGASGTDGAGTENVTLSFAKIHYDYYQQKADGTLGAPVTFGWDVKQNIKV